ncbi:uncharacterized protein [Anoplolepis gracilipes]|uniref:uncharacterized protein n=1 Tax=Anoplolepis gracilipes TaxID=354296 RepID=UPI003BA108D9
MVERLSINQRRGRSRSRPRYRRDESRSKSKDKRAPVSMSPSVCYYHKRFGAKAYRCTKPCIWEEKTKKLVSPAQVAEESQPILGTDFLYQHNLLVDLRNRRLVDGTTNLNVVTKVSSGHVQSVTILGRGSSYYQVFREFIEVTKPGEDNTTKHNVEHQIVTKRPPISDRARRLSPGRMRFAKRELEDWIKNGTCRPGKGQWVSTMHLTKKATGGFMDTALRRLEFCYCYIDDILIASKTEEEHRQHLRQVLQRLKDYELTINVNKCVFGKKEVKYLGCAINEEGIKPLKDKVDAILLFKKPTIMEELRRFLDMKDKRPVQWNEEAEKAFKLCKEQIIANAALLAHPAEGTQLILKTDASDIAIDAVLEQVEESYPSLLEFFSWKLTKTQTQYNEIAAEQQNDQELQTLLQNQTTLSLKPLRLDESDRTIYCDVTDTIRIYVPASLRRKIIDTVHKLSHPGARATQKMVAQRFIWPGMNKNVRDWPEAVPITNISADTITFAFYNTWIARFRAPAIITTDRGSQFESLIFEVLIKLIGSTRIRTTAYHPQSNGIIERWHRSLKTAIKCQTTQNWTEVLPTVLLGLRTSIKDDIKASAAEMVYMFLEKFRQYMRNVRPSPTTHHSRAKPFRHKDLDTSTPPYS